jgi:hypothetical protein
MSRALSGGFFELKRRWCIHPPTPAKLTIVSPFSKPLRCHPRTRPAKPATKKATDQVANWSADDRALVAGGNIACWFDREAIAQRWTPEPTGKRGAPWRDSDGSIQTWLELQQVFHLPSRSLEGFGRSLMRRMGLDLPIPDRTHRSRRARGLTIQIPRQERTGPIHAVADATGRKAFGEGE